MTPSPEGKSCKYCRVNRLFRCLPRYSRNTGSCNDVASCDPTPCTSEDTDTSTHSPNQCAHLRLSGEAFDEHSSNNNPTDNQGSPNKMTLNPVRKANQLCNTDLPSNPSTTPSGCRDDAESMGNGLVSKPSSIDPSGLIHLANFLKLQCELPSNC